eukprot:PITA_34761
MLPMVEDLIQQWDLLDFTPVKGSFTWSNNRVGEDHIVARLDRFLVQGNLMMHKKIIITKILPKLTSDHKLVQLILEEEEDLGPIPFRFSSLWIEREGFIDTMKTTWAKPVTGSSSYVWEQKLKATKQALKDWIKKLVPNPTSERKENVQSLEALQAEMEKGEITPMLLDKEVKNQCSTYQSLRREEEYWRTKSRKGQICKGFSQIKEAAVDHFRQLYTADNHINEEEIADLLSNIPHLVSPEDNSILISPITEEEVSKVIWSMDPEKAPGHDGFTIHFYKICWDIIKIDLLKMVKGFMGKDKVGGGTNSTYLALIPKETNPETFSRLRPISLCNVSYKILAKLLANKIKPLLNKLISNNQGGFVEGRYILNNVIQVQEIIHSSNQRKEKGMLIKLDMANAFDRVNRPFLYKVLLSFGFSPHFVNLITACTHNPWIAPLVNGRPSSIFQAWRGLKQGCPLSPFIYILLVDSLSRKLAAEKASGSLPGLKPSLSSPALNHALFVDNSLLLGGASARIAKAFDSVLNCYCRVSGASINRNKSEIYGWNIGQQDLTSISNLIGFKGHAQWDKINYLGLPITIGINKRSLWTGIISKIKTKITGLGGHWLTKAGKLILIKSVLSALPIYQAAFLLAPKSVTDQISKNFREFLWKGGKGNQNKFHLVKWDVVKRPFSEGGLQIRDPALTNRALGGKIIWKLFKEPNHPVSKMLKTKHAHNIHLRNIQTAHPNQCSQAWKLCSKTTSFFMRSVYRIPRSGRSTNLWQDRIMNCEPLAENEEITKLKHWLERAGIKIIYDLSNWDCHDNWESWDFFGVPERLQQQKSVLEALLEDATPVNRKMKDSWGWGRSGIYTIVVAYNSLLPNRNNSKSPDFWKKVWEPLALPKVNFFFWTLVHNKLLTGDNLMKKSITGPHRCDLCRRSSETARHLFMDCKFAKEVWGLILQELHIPAPTYNSAADIFDSWNQSYPNKIPSKSIWRKVWNAIPKFVCWQIWLTRNDLIFNDKLQTPLMAAAKAKSLLLEAVQQQHSPEDSLLLPEEERWLGPLSSQPRK